MVRNINDHTKKAALKVLKTSFLSSSTDNIDSVEKEIEILETLNHDNIVKLLKYGSDGVTVKPSGKRVGDIVYLLMEYVSGGLLFDLV